MKRERREPKNAETLYDMSDTAKTASVGIPEKRETNAIAPGKRAFGNVRAAIDKGTFLILSTKKTESSMVTICITFPRSTKTLICTEPSPI